MTKQRTRASLVGMAMLLITTTITAQVTEEWVARYDGPASGADEACAIAVDGAGNLYVAGSSERDYATVKYDLSGVEQWVARYNGGRYDEACAMAIDDAGNIYVTGWSGGSETWWDYATVKYNSLGAEQWVARYDEPESYADLATAIAVDGAGNVYVTGYSELSTEIFGPSDYATVKYSSNGEELWVASYDGPIGSRDLACAMAIDGAGNVYVTGWSYGSGTFLDYATVKYSPSGVEQWVARYDGPASFGGDLATAIAVDGAGNVYVTGESDGSETDEDYATVKYSSSGEELWVARYDGPASSIDEAHAIALDGSGNVFVTGYSRGSGTDFDYAIVKYDSSGVEQWVARYDGPASYADLATAIAVDGAGNVYVTGYSEFSTDIFAPSDYATVKYSSNGEELWVAGYDGPIGSRDLACAMTIDGAGNVYVTGLSYGSETERDYATIKYSQGPGVAEASPDVAGHRLEVAQLTPQPVITYTLPAGTRVSLKVYDVTGKVVRTLVSGSQEAGTRTVIWDARNDSNRQVSAGLYFILLETRDFRATGKLVLVR